MLAGVERLIDLSGVQTTAWTGPAEGDLHEMVRLGDVAGLSQTDGHFAAVARDGRPSGSRARSGCRCATSSRRCSTAPSWSSRTASTALRVVPVAEDRLAVRSASTRAWSRRTISSRSIRSAARIPRRAITAFFNPPIAHGPGDIERARRGLCARRVQLASRSGWPACPQASRSRSPSPAASTAPRFSCWRASAVESWAATRAGCARSRWISAAAQMPRRRERSVRATRPGSHSGSAFRCRRTHAGPRSRHRRHRGLPSARRGVRGRVAVPAARGPRAPSALRYLLDGDGGDENLKDYPLEDSDLTLSSVLRNPLLYQEGWGDRRHQAQPDLLRRPLPLVCPHVRARAATSASRRSRRTPSARRSPRLRRSRSRRSSTAASSGSTR